LLQLVGIPSLLGLELFGSLNPPNCTISKTPTPFRVGSDNRTSGIVDGSSGLQSVPIDSVRFDRSCLFFRLVWFGLVWFSIPILPSFLTYLLHRQESDIESKAAKGRYQIVSLAGPTAVGSVPVIATGDHPRRFAFLHRGHQQLHGPDRLALP